MTRHGRSRLDKTEQKKIRAAYLKVGYRRACEIQVDWYRKHIGNSNISIDADGIEYLADLLLSEEASLILDKLVIAEADNFRVCPACDQLVPAKEK